MQRHIRLAAHYPTVMSRRNIKHIARVHLNHAAIIHSRGGVSGNYHSDMLHTTTRNAHRLADMFRPFPTRLVSSTAHGHAADLDNLELALLEHPDLVRIFKPLQDHVHHRVLRRWVPHPFPSFGKGWELLLPPLNLFQKLVVFFT